MKEYIERQAVEEFIQDGLNNPDKDKAFGHDAIEILAGIHFMLAADVAPVVHCRECRHSSPPVWFYAEIRRTWNTILPLWSMQQTECEVGRLLLLRPAKGGRP